MLRLEALEASMGSLDGGRSETIESHYSTYRHCASKICYLQKSRFYVF